MKMYHGDNVIDVNPSKVDEMTMKGWSVKPPSPSKRKAKSKAIETIEENDNGES